MKGAKRKSKFAPSLVTVRLMVGAVMVFLSLNPGLPSARAGSRSDAPSSPAGSQKTPFSHSLPQMDGSRLRAIVVEVNYAPGEADQPHSHPCTVIGYVAQGAVRFQVKGGGPEAIYQAGESFYEPPNGVHQVSANASDTQPARLIAYFICDHETPLTVPPVDGHAGPQAK